MPTITKKNAKAKVLIVYTGGTIGMTPKDPENPSSPLVPAGKKDLQQYVSKLGKAEGIYWDIVGLVDDQGEEVEPLDSSSVDARHWLYMAAAIEKEYENYDGFVVLHGTDTMAYTASGLSFLLVNLAKPVVVTGSQLPISSVRTDAVQNLVNAVHISGYKATNLPRIPEVIIAFGDSILRGNRTRKVSTSSWQGFESPNFPRLGTIGEHIKINEELVMPAADNDRYPFRTVKTIDQNVMDIGLFPGFKPNQFRGLLQLEGLKGVVLRTFGAGNAPEEPEFLDVVSEATKDIDNGGNKKEKKVILNVTQCNQGMVEMGLYAASSGMLERGVISGLDLTPEAALAKMMWILGNEAGEEIQTQLQINQRGEQSENLFDVRYGGCPEPTLVAKSSARASGQFALPKMNRAVLRITDLDIEDLDEAEPFEVRIFMNNPSSSENTPKDDPSCIAIFKENNYTAGGVGLLKDITTKARGVLEEGRAINLNIVCVGARKISYKGLFLALFTRE